MDMTVTRFPKQKCSVLLTSASAAREKPHVKCATAPCRGEKPVQLPLVKERVSVFEQLQRPGMAVCTRCVRVDPGGDTGRALVVLSSKWKFGNCLFLHLCESLPVPLLVLVLAPQLS